jgi:hypothetical protein
MHRGEWLECSRRDRAANCLRGIVHMKKNASLLTLVLTFIAMNALVHLSPALADEKTISGTVSVAKDDDGKPTSVAVSSEDGTKYSIDLDDNGKKIAADLDGKKVTLKGDVKEKDNKLWVTVTEFKKSDE